MARRTVRIVDIAREVGVSPATISAVLNNKATEARISESVQEAVWAAARELGYQPNIAARRLRSSDPAMANIYLAIISASETPLSVAGPMFQGVQAFADQSPNPIQLTLETFHRGRLRQLPGLHDGSRFNAAIIANSAPEDDDFLASADLPMPVALFLRRIDRHSYVTSDASRCGGQAGDLLWRLGRRRFALLAPSGTTQARTERVQGYRAALLRHGVAADQIAGIVAASFSERGGYEAVAAFLAAGGQCDALFAVGDPLAFGAMAALRHHGLRIPQDVAIIGHDDVDMAAFVDPPLTTFHLPLAKMAFDAAEILVDVLGGERKGPIHLVYPSELIVRGSTGPALQGGS